MDDREAYLDRIGELVDRAAYRQALKVCDQAIVAHPDCAEAHDYRGLILARMGRYREALPAYDKALSIEPEFVPALLDKAELLVYHLQDNEPVVALTDRVLRLGAQEVDAAHAHYLKGIAYANLELHGEAVECFDLALAVEPDYPDAHCERGACLLEAYRFHEALKSLKTAASLDLGFGRPHHFLGCLYEHLGEDEIAQREHAKAAELEPEAYPVPLQIEEDDFRQAVQEAVNVLPRPVARAMAGLEIDVARLPDRRQLADRVARPSSTATRLGPPPGADEERQRLVLFQRPLEWLCRTRAQLVEEVAHAIAHELGHPEHDGAAC